MKTKGIVSIIMAVALLATSAVAFAQPMKGWKGSGGWGPGSQYVRMYDPATAVSVTGTVEAVNQVTVGKGMSYGVHVVLKADGGNISVHLGPGWYIERLDTRIEAGDTIEVKGSRVTFQNAPAIIAAEVKKGEAVLKLRDENGFPVWAGWRR